MHGDVKCENVLLTSWSWAVLADFAAPYKPATLPADNPADFSYFFDAGGRRRCYVAPERFVDGGGGGGDAGGGGVGGDAAAQLTPAMVRFFFFSCLVVLVVLCCLCCSLLTYL